MVQRTFWVPVSEGRLSDIVRKEVPARLAGLLLGLSERQDAVAGDAEPRIPARYTHRLLASMVGSNREAVRSDEDNRLVGLSGGSPGSTTGALTGSRAALGGVRGDPTLEAYEVADELRESGSAGAA